MQITSHFGHSKLASNFSTRRTNGMLELPLMKPGFIFTVKMKKIIEPRKSMKSRGNHPSEYMSNKDIHKAYKS